MNGKLKIILLCNSRRAMLLSQKLFEEGVLCAIGTTTKNTETSTLFAEKAGAYGIPHNIFSKESLETCLGNWIREMQPDAVMVLSFPWKIPGGLLSMPKLGFINFHYGLLPQMRGSDPVFECIRQQSSHAGVTVHQMDKDWDTGPILMQEQMQLSPELTNGMLNTQLSYISAGMAQKLVQQLRQGSTLTPVPQNDNNANYWHRVTVRDLYIDWDTMDSTQIRALVRACNPELRTGLPVVINGWTIGLHEVAEVNLAGDTSAIKPGTIVAIDPQNGLLVYCKDGKALKLEVVSSEEGVFPGYKLGVFGITNGTVLTSFSKKQAYEYQ